jgi:hypothetical protein
MEQVRLRTKRDGRILVEIPDGPKGQKLHQYLAFQGYPYLGSGFFQIDRRPEQIQTLLDKAQELSMQVIAETGKHHRGCGGKVLDIAPTLQGEDMIWGLVCQGCGKVILSSSQLI